MYIIFLIKGREYTLNQEDQIFYIDHQKNVKAGELINADKVLFCNGEFKKAPLNNIKLTLEVLGRSKKKTIIFHYNPKKNYKKMKGHNQPYTKVKLKNIEGI